ncbi:unnamed protein product [Rhodiola kirilowii]
MTSSAKLKMEKDAEDGEKVEQVLCMKGGESEASYAKNSDLQRADMFSARHILKESVIDVFNICSSSKCLAVADLGCATGPNALLAISDIVNIVCKTRDDMGHKSPNSFLLFLNDLPSNDFNTIFRSLADFDGLFGRDQCFVMAWCPDLVMAGSSLASLSTLFTHLTVFIGYHRSVRIFKYAFNM